MKKNYCRIALLSITGCMLPVWMLAQPLSPTPSLQLNYAAPRSYLVEDIQVKGLQTLDKEAIIAFSGIKVGDTVTMPGPATTEAIRRLWKQQLFRDVAIYASQAEEHSITLTISITENPRISGYSFQGIKKREKEKLLEKLSLVRGKMVTEEYIKDTKQIIENYFIEAGYPYAAVTITSVPDPDPSYHVQLVIKIEKGKKFRINNIHFEGNHHISSDTLKNQLQHTREKPRITLFKDMLKQLLTLQPIRSGGICWRTPDLEEIVSYFQKHVILFSSKLRPTKLEEDKKQLITYYQSRGFRDASIVGEAVYKQNDNLLNVWIKIEEGNQYRVGTIAWVGNYIYDDDILNQILDIKEGDIYDSSLLQRRLYGSPEGKDVASLYTDDGYFFFHAEPVEVGLEETKVALEIHVQEGPQAHLGRVLIEGNNLTHDCVIRRELRTLPGDKFSRAKLQRSQRELAQLNIFDPAIEIQAFPNATDDTVDLKYRVKERPKFEATLSAGWGEGGLNGVLSLITNNFSFGNLLRKRIPVGAGQTLVLKGEGNLGGHKNLALEFTEPWLWGAKPRQFHLGFNRSFEENSVSTGGKVSLGTRLTWPDDYLLLRTGTAYCRHSYTKYDLLDTGDKSHDGALNDLSANILLERNSTDSPIYPKEGSKLELNVRFTPPWSWLLANQLDDSLPASEKYRYKEYHQCILDGSYFLQLLDTLVLSMRAQLGILGKFPSQKSIGPFERFYLGGEGTASRSLRGEEKISLRGYKDGYFTPKDKETGYKGGVIYDKLVLELRYPIVSHYIAHLYALVFVEGGNAWVRYKDFSSHLKKSAGLGFRVYLPIFFASNIGLDFGYGFDKRGKDHAADKFEIHFSMGVSPR